MQFSMEEEGQCNTTGVKCNDGLFLPLWLPCPEDVPTSTVVSRGITYILAMAYLFVGIAYLADVFMSSIEMITSTKKEVCIKDDQGREQTVVVRIWNQTIANLTLIALGGAAPEVFLAIIETIKAGFETEELGPSEIVASASFNLMFTIGVVIYIIPKGEHRKIQHLPVFLVVSVWSIFAYIWLVLITVVISPGVVYIWEALVTLSFFPLTLISAYVADRYLLKKNEEKNYGLGFRRGIIVETTGANKNEGNLYLKRFSVEENKDEVRQFEDHRRDFIVVMKDLRRKYPMMDAKQLELMATKELLDRGTKSKAFYRIKASKKLTGLSSWRMRQESSRTDVDFTKYHHNKSPRTSISNQVSNNNVTINDRRVTEVFFSPGHYTVEEDIGVLTATVVRQSGDLNRQVLVDYATEDADAIAGKDYTPVQGTLCFNPGSIKKQIAVNIIDDLVYEGDQHFYIRLFNIRYGETSRKGGEKGTVNPDAYLVLPSIHYNRLRSSSTSSAKSDSVLNNLPILPRRILGRAISFRQTSPQNNDQSSVSTENTVIPTIHLIHPSDGTSAESTKEVLLDVKTIPSRPTPSLYSQSSIDEEESSSYLRLVCPSLATVMILDDDHHGIFTLAKREIVIAETAIEVCSVQIIRCGGTRGRVVLPYRTEEGTALPDKDYQHCEGELIFENGEIEKIVPVPIVVKSVNHEDVLFFFYLGEPRILKDEEERDSGLDFESEPSSKPSPAVVDQLMEQTTEEQRLTYEGRPQLGEISHAIIRVKESQGFKNALHRLVKKSQVSLKEGTSPWKQQFIDAVHLERDEIYEENHNGEIKPPTWWDYVRHWITIFWRLVFACLPPTELFAGYATFFSSICMIAILVVFLGDLAYALGCQIGLRIKVTSLVFVSVGTSVPDLFASKVFAQRNPYADASITNVFGSNIIQVYMGLGCAWTMASIYQTVNGHSFYVDEGTLGFMGTLFICMAVIVVCILLLRRKYAGGELGGPDHIKIPTSIFFICMWLTFVLVNSLEAYDIISVF